MDVENDGMETKMTQMALALLARIYPEIRQAEREALGIARAAMKDMDKARLQESPARSAGGSFRGDRSHGIVSPEICQWIAMQAKTGHGVPSLLQAMRQAGWSESQAIEAIRQTLYEQFGVPSNISSDDSSQEELPPVSPVPEPDLSGSPTVIDVGDRQVRVLLSLAHPRIVVFGGLLSPEECDEIIESARPRLERSRTVDMKTGGDEINDVRTSDGMFFQRGETSVLQRVEERIARLVRWPVEKGEGIQVLHYRPGAEYKAHYDYFDPAAPGAPKVLTHGGQRVGTVVMYLNTPEKGGATGFPEIGLEVAAHRGNAVFFSYNRPHPSSGSLHAGCPVIAGEKWIAVKWMREKEFT